MLIIVRDVTERDRLAEEATQLRLRQQQEVLAAILTTQETERKRIAEALHNGLGQLLYATKLSLEERRRGGASARGRPQAAATKPSGPPAPFPSSSRPAFWKTLACARPSKSWRSALRRRACPCTCTWPTSTSACAPQVEIAVYRMVQELLNNVMKHAHATEVVVHVARENGRVEVSVEDNGTGFDPRAAHRPSPWPAWAWRACATAWPCWAGSST